MGNRHRYRAHDHVKREFATLYYYEITLWGTIIRRERKMGTKARAIMHLTNLELGLDKAPPQWEDYKPYKLVMGYTLNGNTTITEVRHLCNPEEELERSRVRRSVPRDRLQRQYGKSVFPISQGMVQQYSSQALYNIWSSGTAPSRSQATPVGGYPTDGPYYVPSTITIGSASTANNCI